MRPVFPRLWRRMPVRGDDSGAALIYALLFITVIAIAIAAVLTLADTSLRTTQGMRDQAAAAAAADGAAQIAINQIRAGTYAGPANDCFPATSLDLQNIYQQPNGSYLSARVECAYDASLSVRGGATGTGFALLTLPQGLQDGLTLKATGNGGMQAAGDVGSTGRSHIDAGKLVSTRDFTSASCQVDNGGSISDSSGPIVPASPECATPTTNIPSYVLPTGAAPNNLGTWSPNNNCNGVVRTFSPGLYASNQALNALNDNCGLSYFQPGIYWFAFDGLWKTRNTKVVAGALTAPPLNVNMATACPSPFTNPTAGAGVIFVFGGNARWQLDNGGQAAVCGAGSQVAGQPPFALFGVTSPVTGTAGTVAPPAAGSCILKDKDAGGNAACATFQTVNHSDIKLYLNGATYLPNGWLDLDLRGSADQYIVGGLVVRQFQLFSPASATLPEPLSSGPLPGGGPGGARAVVYLTVHVCPGGGTCSAGGVLRLKVKVGINDPTGIAVPGVRNVTVYSWSVQR